MTQQDNRFYKELSSLQGGIDNQQLLDSFAKAAMQGILSAQTEMRANGISHGSISTTQLAEEAYDIATALIQERERRMKG